MNSNWQLLYYIKQDGTKPVEEYIRNLSVNERAKTLAFIEFFRQVYRAGNKRVIMNYKEHLAEEMKNPEFRKAFEEEKRLLELSYAITKTRKKCGLTQRELAEKSHVTQQQLSKIENGVNCNMLTFIKVSNALGLGLTVSS
jgi:DNA-binding XRE family transcriptional regulator